MEENININDIDFKRFCDAFNRSPYNLMELIKFKEFILK